MPPRPLQQSGPELCQSDVEQAKGFRVGGKLPAVSLGEALSESGSPSWSSAG